MFGLGFWEMLLVGVIAVMLYGKRLPEVAKSFGATYRQFRRQLNDLQSQFSLDDITGASTPHATPQKSYSDYEDRDVISAPRFEPPPMPSADAEIPPEGASSKQNSA
jgi:sec-independent protein translocase protein TatA